MLREILIRSLAEKPRTKIFGYNFKKINYGNLDFGHWQAATNRTSEEQLQKMFCRLKQSHVLKNLIIPLIKSKYSNTVNLKKFKEQLKILNFCV